MPSPGRWGHSPVPSQGWGPPRGPLRRLRQDYPCPHPAVAGNPPRRPHKDGFPPGAPGPVTAPAPGHQPLSWEPARPVLVQLKTKARRTPPHPPRPRLPSRLARANSDTLDVRFSRLRNRGSELSRHLHEFCHLSSANSLKLNTGSFCCSPGSAISNCPSNFQPLVPVPAPRPYPTLSLHHVTGLYRYAPARSSSLSFPFGFSLWTLIPTRMSPGRARNRPGPAHSLPVHFSRPRPDLSHPGPVQPSARTSDPSLRP